MASAFEHDRCKLQFRLAYLQALLAEAEVKAEASRAVEPWVACIRSLAGHARGVLDRAPRRGDDEALAAAGALRCFARRRSRREMRRMLRLVDRLVDEYIDPWVHDVLRRTRPPRRESHSLLCAPHGIHGRDGDREAVVALLLGQRDRRGAPQVLPVTGTRGLGKTTLAQVVFNDPRVEAHFDLRVWHWVSDTREAAGVMRHVIESATGKRCDLPDTTDMEALRRRAVGAVAGRRLLLVLDDMWGFDWRGRWDDVMRSLRRSSPPIGGPGSVIVVTTRSRRVADLVGTLPAHEVPRLSEEESWELFSRKAFAGARVREDDADGVAAAGRRIAGECSGVPLALVVMGEHVRSARVVLECLAVLCEN